MKYIGIALLIAAGFVLLTLGLAFLLFRLAFGAGQLPGLRLGDPLGLLGHKAVRLGPVHPQGDADGHRAVPPDPQVELFHLAAGALIPFLLYKSDAADE